MVEGIREQWYKPRHVVYARWSRDADASDAGFIDFLLEELKALKCV